MGADKNVAERIEPEVRLDDPRHYIHRELSLLRFFERVLAMGGDPETPVLERLRFLTICSTIVDEFFEIRVAGLKQRVELGIVRKRPDGLTQSEALRAIRERVSRLVQTQYKLLNKEVLPAMARAGIRIVKRADWTSQQTAWINTYFHQEVAPVLTPVGLDPAHPFPRVLNKSLNLIVSLKGTDAFGRQSDYAVVPVPRCLPRVIALPEEATDGENDFVLLSSVIHANVNLVFPGMEIRGCHQFRVTRNADLWVDEEEVEDLLDALKGELFRRRYGDAVRLEVAENCPGDEVGLLRAQFDLSDADVYRVDGPVNLHRLQTIYDLVEAPDEKFPSFLPKVIDPTGQSDFFELLGRTDVLLHHPFQSFSPVVELLRQAADDPAVLAIKQTVYRTGAKSPMVEALVKAARSGKEVTAVIEHRARFDEEANIDLATRLQDAGANVVYGVVGFKTHSKMLLIVRRESGAIRRYVHLGTGNYHTGTARAYTDFSLMTAKPAVTLDVHHLFMQLTGLGRAKALEKLLQSPFTLQRRLVEHLEFEAAEARAGRPSRVIIKVNSISDSATIQAMYSASQAGVNIDLIVRGICCLRPGIPKVSDNIRVISIVGRFLEHTRIYYFHAAGEQRVYCSSADLMDRNLYRRVETCFPIEDPELKARVISEGLEAYLEDNTGSWRLGSDGEYKKIHNRGAKRNAQRSLLDRLSDPHS